MPNSTKFSLTNYFPNTWNDLLQNLNKTKTSNKIEKFLTHEYQANLTIYPPKKSIFKALEITSPKKVKVIILGQDPYHNPNQAHGLAFSIQEKSPIPPSLKNIFKELKNDLPQTKINHGNLTSWAKQGILLLNTILTVRAQEAFSHQNQGWELITDEIINYLNKQNKNLIFVLWGNSAKNKKKLIGQQHTIFEAAHPSPLSAYRGFFGCSHFSKINKCLSQHQQSTINWQLT